MNAALEKARVAQDREGRRAWMEVYERERRTADVAKLLLGRVREYGVEFEVERRGDGGKSLAVGEGLFIR